ncbi:MAG: carbohydrate ABC transporter permease, partial [Candidatus Eisenbacteria bacterium]|nr:carbohydrate ABC transporter permease [Candidatus Eisenbacteria bacterium]
MEIKTARTIRKIVVYTGLTAAAIVVLFPFFWMIVTALKQPGQAFTPEIFPQSPTLDNFRRVLADYGFARYFLN